MNLQCGRVLHVQLHQRRFQLLSVAQFCSEGIRLILLSSTHNIHYAIADLFDGAPNALQIAKLSDPEPP